MDGYQTFECAEWSDFSQALSNLCRDVKERVIPTQYTSGKSFSHIRVEIWEDSGRVIAYPALDVDNRIDVAGAQVQCMEICDDILALDNSPISDEAYDRAIGKIVRTMSKVIHSVFDLNVKFSFRVFDQDGNAI